jgi:hypothetical protein
MIFKIKNKIQHKKKLNKFWINKITQEIIKIFNYPLENHLLIKANQKKILIILNK